MVGLLVCYILLREKIGRIFFGISVLDGKREKEVEEMKKL